MSKHCGYCNQYIDPATDHHIHDPKTCRQCGKTLPAVRFPIHPSAADGRRRECKDCLDQEKVVKKTESASQREEYRKWRRARFKAHNFEWVLKAPDGTICTPDEADQLIEEKERDNHDPGDYF